jgi:hypothetical protein
MSSKYARYKAFRWDGSTPRRRLRPQLHHIVTGFVALLCAAHFLSVCWTIQYEEVWEGLPAWKKATRAARILLFDSYLPRTKFDIRAACPVSGYVPKVTLQA